MPLEGGSAVVLLVGLGVGWFWETKGEEEGEVKGNLMKGEYGKGDRIENFVSSLLETVYLSEKETLQPVFRPMIGLLQVQDGQEYQILPRI